MGASKFCVELFILDCGVVDDGADLLKEFGVQFAEGAQDAGELSLLFGNGLEDIASVLETGFDFFDALLELLLELLE